MLVERKDRSKEGRKGGGLGFGGVEWERWAGEKEEEEEREGERMMEERERALRRRRIESIAIAIAGEWVD